ncbi:MAG: DNA methyltransferase, partial [Pseudomonadota bacterium]
AQFAAAWDAAGFKTVGHIVWPKPYASRASHALYRHESAFILAKGYPQKPANPISDIQPWRYTGNKDHPTQKSVGIIEPLIESFSKPGDLVLDPFLGSGTAAIAAALKGREYIGIELEPSYCELARQRLARLHEAGKLQVPIKPEPPAVKSTRSAEVGSRRASMLFPSVTDLIAIQP